MNSIIETNFKTTADRPNHTRHVLHATNHTTDRPVGFRPIASLKPERLLKGWKCRATNERSIHGATNIHWPNPKRSNLGHPWWRGTNPHNSTSKENNASTYPVVKTFRMQDQRKNPYFSFGGGQYADGSTTAPFRQDEISLPRIYNRSPI